ncbi:MAG: hypothetical protein Q8O15_01360 [Rectinemataceae bacterium]|nr:hypothetical protein [Rectinemataceae bacterium]
MKNIMKKYTMTLALSFALVVGLSAQTQTLSFTAKTTTGTKAYLNNEQLTWVNGAIIVSRSNTTTNPTFTIDLAPNAGAVGGVYHRNADWRFYDTSGNSSIVNIDGAEIYVGSTNSSSSPIFKLWDAAGIGDTGVTSSNVVTGNFVSTNLTRTYYFCAVFMHNTNLPAGTYELPITFRLRQEAFVAGEPTTAPIATAAVVLRYVVGTTATVFFRDTLNGPEIFQLAFDEVTAATPKTFYIHVQSNFKYYVNVRSVNLGYLVHERYNDPITPVNEKIGYTMQIGTTTIPLASGSYKYNTSKYSTTGFGTTTRSFTSTITLSDVTNYSAGRYSDILAFTITAN